MKKSAYGQPIHIDGTNSQLLNRVEKIDEASIQNLVFDFPECLPISEIDESYNPLVPICKELYTPVGPLDILMVTPNGDLSIIETKLWRNPEARRKVIAQILDYANELHKWSYEDLQRELNKKFKSKGNILFEILNQAHPDLMLSEADLVDAVSRNLARGKFLLLIVGDGIKEGAASITDFLSSSAHMNFTFGMVELNLYSLNENERIVLPRTIAKTTEIQKISIELPEGFRISNSFSEAANNASIEKSVSPELVKQRKYFNTFWKEFINELELDDPGQPIPNPTITNNLYVYPGKNKYAWISAYFSKSSGRVGVYFRCQNDQNGLRIADGIAEYKTEIREELGEEIIWSWDQDPKDGFGVRLPLRDVYAKENRQIIKEFFGLWINRFVNALRPRLKEFQ